jgi:hypothetical protein
MTTLEIIKELCEKEGIKISILEKEMGYGNGSLSKANKFPADRILDLSRRFNVPMEYLMTGEEIQEIEQPLTKRDEKDIAKDLENIMSKIKNGEDGPLHYNGEEIDPESLSLLEDAINLSLKQLKIINKEKYNPSKNKK